MVNITVDAGLIQMRRVFDEMLRAEQAQAAE